MKLDPELPAALMEHYKLIMSGLAPFNESLVAQGKQRMEEVRLVNERIMIPLIQEFERTQGIKLLNPKQTRHKDGSVSIKADATLTRSANGVKLEQSGSFSANIDQTKNLTYSLNLRKSTLSVGGSVPFRIGRGAQTDLLSMFYTDHQTFKKKKYNIDEICQKLDGRYDDSGAAYKTKLRKRYYDARCDLNDTIRANSNIGDDFLLYVNRHMFIDKEYLKN